MLVFAADWLDAINYDLNIHQTLIEVTFQIDFNCFRSCAHQLEEHVKWTVPLSLEHISRLPLWWKTVYWLTLSFRLFLGYTSLHDRNDNSTPPSGATQMSYLQMNSLRNGSNASSGTAGNQTSIYPTMLKEENPSSTNSSYPSLSELSVRFQRRKLF